ncbi:MAG: hypothetical protein F4Y68_13470 [Boseongicola sp. SB0665_bin_10]|nr:hypothetical protein [Boseongicola sp. SB0665_bin_10]
MARQTDIDMPERIYATGGIPHGWRGYWTDDIAIDDGPRNVYIRSDVVEEFARLVAANAKTGSRQGSELYAHALKFLPDRDNMEEET